MSGTQEPGGRFVRPYAITGGRTGGEGRVLELESQVVATPGGRSARTRYRWEAARVIELCDRPVALVEVAARLEVPIGVARVVVTDLAEAGALELIEPEVETSYADLLERVLDGIRNL